MGKQLRVSELDFDQIKQNLIDFMSSSEEFKDYNFEGSAINTIMDLLAYNTHYEAIIANQLAQELSIETSNNRNVVGLHAKRMGYTPRSYTAARTSVDIEVINPEGSPSVLTLGKNASFIATTGSETYNFTNITPKTISRNSDGRYIFKDIMIYEGTQKTFRYVVDASSYRYEIPDANVDTNLLRVFVQQSTTNTSRVEYFKADRITKISDSSTAYYLQMNARGKYEVRFGDGILGKKPDVGNVIVLDYIVTNGSLGNEITSIAFNDIIEGNSSTVLTQSTKTYGGAEMESLASIRFNAAKSTMVQDRAVTEYDYVEVISEAYSVGAISVWGGERNDPPVYGRVFISVKPLDSDSVLTESNKQDIKNYLTTNKSITGMVPEFVDVDYTYIEPTITVYLDDAQINTSADYVKSLVIKEVISYSKTNLEKFDKVFRFSKFSKMIDDVDTSILSNITSIRVAKRFTPATDVYDSWTIAFNNPLTSGSITSTTFNMQGSTADLRMKDVNGVIQAVYTENTVEKVFVSDMGTVDYSTGKISLNSTMFTSYMGDYIKISATPSSPDIISLRNTILEIDQDRIGVSPIIESSNNQDHKFVSA